MLNSNQFLAYLWAYWCAATKARRRNELAEHQRTERERQLEAQTKSSGQTRKRTTLKIEESGAYDAMLSLCTALVNVGIPAEAASVEFLPEYRPKDPAGFVRAIQALWVRPHRKAVIDVLGKPAQGASMILGRETLVLERVDKLFARGGTVYATLVSFIETAEFAGIVKGGISGLDTGQHAIYERILGRSAPAIVPFDGVFLVAKDPGVHWLGLRNYDDVRDVAHGQEELTDEQLIPFIRQHLDRVRACAGGEPAGWWTASGIRLDLSRAQHDWSLFVDELIENVVGEDHKKALTERPRLSLDFTESASDLHPQLTRLLAPFVTKRTTVWVVTNVTTADAIRVIKGAVPAKGPLHVEVFGAEHIAAVLSRCPRLLTKYFGGDAHVAFARADAVYDLLYRGTPPRPTTELIERDTINALPRPEGKVSFVRGKRGSGKTVALAQLLKRWYPEATVVAIRKHAMPADLDLVAAFVRDWRGPIAVAIDDVDLDEEVARACMRIVGDPPRYPLAGSGAARPESWRDAQTIELGVLTEDEAARLAARVVGERWEHFCKSQVHFWIRRLADGMTLTEYVHALSRLRPLAERMRRHQERLLVLYLRGLDQEMEVDDMPPEDAGDHDQVTPQAGATAVECAGDDADAQPADSAATATDSWQAWIDEDLTATPTTPTARREVRRVSREKWEEHLFKLARRSATARSLPELRHRRHFAEMWNELAGDTRVVHMLQALSFVRWCGCQDAPKELVRLLCQELERDTSLDLPWFDGVWASLVAREVFEEHVGVLNVDHAGLDLIADCIADESTGLGLAGERLIPFLARSTESTLAGLQEAFATVGLHALTERSTARAAVVAALDLLCRDVSDSELNRGRLIAAIVEFAASRVPPATVVRVVRSILQRRRDRVGAATDLVVLCDSAGVKTPRILDVASVRGGPPRHLSAAHYSAFVIPLFDRGFGVASESFWIGLRDAFVSGGAGVSTEDVAKVAVLAHQMGATVRAKELFYSVVAALPADILPGLHAIVDSGVADWAAQAAKELGIAGKEVRWSLLERPRGGRGAS